MGLAFPSTVIPPPNLTSEPPPPGSLPGYPHPVEAISPFLSLKTLAVLPSLLHLWWPESTGTVVPSYRGQDSPYPHLICIPSHPARPQPLWRVGNQEPTRARASLDSPPRDGCGTGSSQTGSRALEAVEGGAWGEQVPSPPAPTPGLGSAAVPPLTPDTPTRCPLDILCPAPLEGVPPAHSQAGLAALPLPSLRQHHPWLCLWWYRPRWAWRSHGPS